MASLRHGTTPKTVLYGELNGSPPEEIVVLSEGKLLPRIAIHRPFLDIYSWRQGVWKRVFDATLPQGGQPPLVSKSENSGGVGQDWFFLKLVDFHQDGSPEVVAMDQVIGADAGPATIWVLNMAASDSVTVSFTETVSETGGPPTIHGDQVILPSNDYFASDSFNAPSILRKQVIGVTTNGQIGIVSTSVSIIPVDTPLKAADRFFLAWQAGDRRAMLAFATNNVLSTIARLGISAQGVPPPSHCAPLPPVSGISCDTDLIAFQVKPDSEVGYRVVGFGLL